MERSIRIITVGSIKKIFSTVIINKKLAVKRAFKTVYQLGKDKTG
jgi:hypothetical protein